MAMNYISVEAAKVIEDEIRKLIEGGEQTAKQILEEYRDDLHAVAKGLLEFETLSSADVKEILKGNQFGPKSSFVLLRVRFAKSYQGRS